MWVRITLTVFEGQEKRFNIFYLFKPFNIFYFYLLSLGRQRALPSDIVTGSHFKFLPIYVKNVIN